jgi:hypothetical protein
MSHRHSAMTLLSFVIGPLMVVALVAGCSDIQINSTYGPQGQLTGIGPNYAWAPASEATAEARSLGGPELQKMVESTIEQQLAKKGFKKVTDNTANFWLDYKFTKKEETDSGVIPSGQLYEAGALIVDVVKPGSNTALWRGVAYTRINPANTPEVRKQRLTQAVDGIMKVFPPK